MPVSSRQLQRQQRMYARLPPCYHVNIRLVDPPPPPAGSCAFICVTGQFQVAAQYIGSRTYNSRLVFCGGEEGVGWVIRFVYSIASIPASNNCITSKFPINGQCQKLVNNERESLYPLLGDRGKCNVGWAKRKVTFLASLKSFFASPFRIFTWRRMKKGKEIGPDTFSHTQRGAVRLTVGFLNLFLAIRSKIKLIRSSVFRQKNKGEK